MPILHPNMSSDQNLPILHAIASQLNQEVDLKRSLQIVLEKTVQLLGLETGWIWLFQPDTNSVYLAASYQLPPAFTQHPERLSGWCYCIDKYLGNQMESSINISEITCTRLKDLKKGTKGLLYHASVPLYLQEQKIGILNLLSGQSQELQEEKLNLLHSIGDLLSQAIQRARLFEQSQQIGAREERQRLSQQMNQQLLPDIQTLSNKLKATQIWQEEGDTQKVANTLQDAEQLTQKLAAFLKTAAKEVQHLVDSSPTSISSKIQYPGKPLTPRELEVLEFLKSGQSNLQIATSLYISERTVKFHVSSLLEKLQAGNRLEAVHVAIQRGIIKR